MLSNLPPPKMMQYPNLDSVWFGAREMTLE